MGAFLSLTINISLYSNKLFKYIELAFQLCGTIGGTQLTIKSNALVDKDKIIIASYFCNGDIMHSDKEYEFEGTNRYTIEFGKYEIKVKGGSCVGYPPVFHPGPNTIVTYNHNQTLNGAGGHGGPSCGEGDENNITVDIIDSVIQMDIGTGGYVKIIPIN